MATRDYYLLLGVSPTESSSGIRSAFRHLVRRFHPDRAGPHSARFFQRVVEAYDVLSDDERRASYDRGLHHGVGPMGTPPPAQPLRTEPPAGRRSAEPLVPGAVSLLDDFHVIQPSREEVLDRVRSSFGGRERQPEVLHLEVAISRAQALRGGLITLGIPVYYPCSFCRGSGRAAAMLPCGHCEGDGLALTEEPLRVELPPLIPDGTTLHLPLRGLGIHNLVLALRVRVAHR